MSTSEGNLEEAKKAFQEVVKKSSGFQQQKWLSSAKIVDELCEHPLGTGVILVFADGIEEQIECSVETAQACWPILVDFIFLTELHQKAQVNS